VRDIKNPLINLFETIKRRLPLRSKPQIHFCPTIFGEAISMRGKMKFRLDNYYERRNLGFVKRDWLRNSMPDKC